MSAEALLILDGIVASTIIEGSMTKAIYMEYPALNIVSVLDSSFDFYSHALLLLPKCPAFLGPLSVWLWTMPRFITGRRSLILWMSLVCMSSQS